MQSSGSGISGRPGHEIPPDDLQRVLTLAQPDKDQNLPHIGIAGDTYTILLTGNDTNGRFCLIDMYVPPGGGPPPHRHDFEETFIILEGEIEATFRGNKMVIRAGDTVNIPSNAPHQFHNNRTNPPACFAFVRLPVWRTSSCRSARRSRVGRLPRQSQMRQRLKS